MYESFYGLTSKPFQLNPDPHFFFNSRQHGRAKAYLEYGVSRHDGFIVITGEIGAGKTTVLRGLLESLGDSDIVAGQLVTTQLDADDMLRMVCAAFGIGSKDLQKSQLLSTFEAFLLTQATQRRRCLLVIDEAQNLSVRALEELRMLSNFQLGGEALLQSFLVGQPEFRDALRRPDMEQFRQRVAATCHIGPLDASEIEGYIGHRLQRAGSSGQPRFETEAYRQIHVASQGIPRRINSICDRLLLLGFMENRKLLTTADATRVIDEFAEEGRAHARLDSPVRRVVAGGDAVEFSAANGAGTSNLRLAPLKLERSAVDDMSRAVGSLLGNADTDERLRRLEQSIARLEQNSLQTLATLHDLIGALIATREGDGA